VLTLTLVVGEPPPHRADGRLVQQWVDEAGDVYATAFTDGARRWIDWAGLATFAFSRGSTVVRAWPAPGARRQLVVETFSRVLQPIVMQAIGWQALHASAVVVGGGVVALCGRSGSGKSTIAYALSRDHDQWADDGVILSLEGRGVVAHRVPFTPRLRPESQVLRPTRSGTPAGQSTGVRELPLASVAVLRQESGSTTAVHWRRLPPAEAFHVLVTHAHCFDPGDPDDARQFAQDYLTMAGAVPVFEVTYRPGLENLETVTAAVLHSVAGHEHQDERPAAVAPF
jgi:hypothetical protein